MLRTRFTSISRTVVASSSRTFYSTPIAAKTTTEKVKEVASDVNIKVGQTLASAIEKGEQATEATKEAVGATNLKAAADNVNKKVGRGLASGIEKGEEAKESTKQTLDSAAAKTKETANVAGQKANQAAAGAREGKEDFKADVKKELRK